MVMYKVEPKIGVGPVKLGMSREEVRNLMTIDFKENKFYEADDFHKDGSFHVVYDKEQLVEYIAVSHSIEVPIIYRNIDVFNTKALDLVAEIEKEYAYDKNDSELGYSFIFPEIELSLYRPVIPNADVARWQPEQDIDWDDEDYEDFYYFQTIIIGREGYYSKK